MERVTRRRVLLVDNQPDFLDTCTEFLETSGYSVVRATSLEAGRNILRTTWVHLAVLDLRLTDDLDDKDVGGLTLAQESSPHILKIILSRFPSWQAVRSALAIDDDGHAPAAAFVAKQDGLLVLKEEIDRVFARDVRLDESLAIRWMHRGSFLELAATIGIELDGASFADVVYEVEDLFRKLFFGQVQIAIGRCLARGEGYVLLEVFAFRNDPAVDQVFVLCGHRSTSDAPPGNLATTSNGVGLGAVEQWGTADTLRFTGSGFRLVGSSLGNVLTLREFYPRASVAEMTSVVDDLLNSTLAARLANPSQRRDARFAGRTGASTAGEHDTLACRTNLMQRVTQLCGAAEDTGLVNLRVRNSRLQLHLPGTSEMSVRIDDLWRTGLAPSDGAEVMASHHGRVRPDTVIITHLGKTALLDFDWAHKSTALDDFIALELAVRVELLDSANLSDRLELERQILAAGAETLADAELPGFDGGTSLRTVVCVRQGVNRYGYDLDRYLRQLCRTALTIVGLFDDRLRYTRGELSQLIHYLVVALAAHIQIVGLSHPHRAVPVEAQSGLWIDKTNKEVWREGRQIHLAPQEFRIIDYLYERAGHLCQRQAIIAEGLQGDPRAREDVERLNTIIARLRRKLEPDTKRPRYLLNVRGHGYKLVVEPPRVS